MPGRYIPGRQIFKSVEFLGPAPILKNERGDDYFTLLEQIWTDVEPRDAFERISVREAVDDTWLVGRARRLGEMIAPGLLENAGELATEHYTTGPMFAETEASRVARVQPHAEFARRAQAADDLITKMSRRRNKTIHGIEARRFAFDKALRMSVNKAKIKLDSKHEEKH